MPIKINYSIFKEIYMTNINPDILREAFHYNISQIHLKRRKLKKFLKKKISFMDQHMIFNLGIQLFMKVLHYMIKQVIFIKFIVNWPVGLHYTKLGSVPHLLRSINLQRRFPNYKIYLC